MSDVEFPHLERRPRLDPSAFVAPGAQVIGDVEIGPESSVWFGTVLRGDVNEIRIGARTNIQDGTVIHVATDGQGSYLGDDVTIGHQCIIHACTIETRGYVGMACTLLDGSVVETDAMLGAGALLTSGKRVPSGQLWTGAPARYRRDLEPGELEEIRISSARYVRLSRQYLARWKP